MTRERERKTPPDQDEAFIATLRRARIHPFLLGLLAVFAAAALFLMGRSIGAAAYGAFEGDGMRAAIFGVTLVVVVTGIVAIGVRLDRRQRRRRADRDARG